MGGRRRGHSCRFWTPRPGNGHRLASCVFPISHTILAGPAISKPVTSSGRRNRQLLTVLGKASSPWRALVVEALIPLRRPVQSEVIRGAVGGSATSPFSEGLRNNNSNVREKRSIFVVSQECVQSTTGPAIVASHVLQQTASKRTVIDGRRHSR